MIDHFIINHNLSTGNLMQRLLTPTRFWMWIGLILALIRSRIFFNCGIAINKIVGKSWPVELRIRIMIMFFCPSGSGFSFGSDDGPVSSRSDKGPGSGIQNPGPSATGSALLHTITSLDYRVLCVTCGLLCLPGMRGSMWRRSPWTPACASTAPASRFRNTSISL